MNDKELIEEARRLEENYGGRYEIMTHMSALADALEARQPSENDREAKAEALKEWQSSNEIRRYSEFYTSWEDGYDAGFSRAAVPDAANRELTEAIRLTVEYVGNDMLPAIDGWDWYDALVKYAPEVAQAFVDKPIHFPKSAERDAALAAIERVRAIHAPGKIIDVWGKSMSQADDFLVCVECTGPDNSWIAHPCPTVAALDGAPEPEWEERTIYGSQLETGHITIEPRGLNYATHRRTARYSPWLPVGGESK